MKDDTEILSPLEHVFYGVGAYTITVAFSFSSVLDRSRLEESLERTLAQFPWLQHRLEQTPDGRSLRLSAGVSPVSLEAGALDSSRGQGTKFVGPLESTVGSPLARFCLTETSSGSVLGASMSHAIADGSSFFYFMVNWARITRGEPVLGPVRVAMPASTEGIDEPTAERILSDCGLFSGGARENITSDHLKEEFLYLSPVELASIRESAQRESDVRLSTNDLVTAYLWQKLGPDWCNAAGETESFLTCPVDGRAVAGIPPNHFGCALGFAVARMEADRLAHASLGDLATRVRTAIKSVTADTLQKASGTLARVRQRDGLAGVQSLHARHPTAGMVVTNMTRVPLAELDFGSGAPTSFASDAAEYHAASLYSHPAGIEVRFFGKPDKSR